jgi:predicted TIM-barrel fold metal-dependent hydrolase
MRIDAHQHVWTEPLLERLAARSEPPLIARRRGGLAILHARGERPFVLADDAGADERRAAELRADGLDLALVSMSSPIGVEALAREAALELIAAQLQGVRALGPAFLPWGPLALDGAQPADVDALLRAGCVGVSLPAGALASFAWLERVGPLLERLSVLKAPLFVHPGPAPGAPAAPEIVLDEPLWWRALTDYVAQMQAAWLVFATRGRREHPRLRVVFAMLAGLAPALGERLATRGGPPVQPKDPLTFYDTSSYGADAVETMVRLVGERQLLYGSDRPVVQPIATARDRELQENAAELLAAGAALRAA